MIRGGGRRGTLALAVAGLAVGCGGDSGAGARGAPPPAFAMDAVSFAPELDVALERMELHPSGMYLEDLEEGEGTEVAPGSRVTAHYTGWLPDGTEFDSSRQSGRPFGFTVGVGEVIQGWDRGLLGMRTGGVRRLVIPPDLAYGAQGAGGVIPPNSALVFEVEIVDVAEPEA